MPLPLQALISESDHSKQKLYNRQATWHPKEETAANWDRGTIDTVKLSIPGKHFIRSLK